MKVGEAAEASGQTVEGRVKGREPRERKRGWQCCSCERRERNSANVRVGPCLRLCTVAGLIPTENKLLLQDRVLAERRKNRAVHLVCVSLT